MPARLSLAFESRFLAAQGNPTGNSLPVENVRDIINFCSRNDLVLMADEVYQENVYDSARPFNSFKKASLALLQKTCSALPHADRRNALELSPISGFGQFSISCSTLTFVLCALCNSMTNTCDAFARRSKHPYAVCTPACAQAVCALHAQLPCLSFGSALSALAQ
eukprot:6209332-Pleurochrysis_carterae.AAC.1